MPKYVIKIVCCVNGQPTEFDNKYIVSYDPNFHWEDGRYDGGDLEVSPNIQQAKHFDGAEEALIYYRQSPTCVEHREDSRGHQNRPLTAFTVAFEGIPDVTSTLANVVVNRNA